MKYLKFYLLNLLIVLGGCDLLSTNEQRLNENPPHLITGETLFTDLSGFETGLNGLYALLRQELEPGLGGHQLQGAIFRHGTDNLVTNHWTHGIAIIAQYWGDQNNPDQDEYRQSFEWLYSIVNTANTIIRNAEREDIDWGSSGSSADHIKQRVIAEARAARAWAYRHLSYGWGDVPLNLEESTGTNIRTDWERTDVSVVRDQIISDLLFAEEFIPTEASMPGRFTKGAIQHYLAEMYLTIGDPDSSLKWSQRVIDTPEYELITERYGVRADEPGVPFMDMFYDGNTNREEGNTEALWVHQFGLNITGGGGSNFRRYHLSRYYNWNVEGVRPISITNERGGRGFARSSLTQWAINNYETNDDRGSEYAIRKFFVLKDSEMNAPYPADIVPEGYAYGDTLWLDWSEDITYETNARLNWPYSRKVDDGTDPLNIQADYQHHDQIALRLAETYLLKAEAQYLLGNASGAAETINVLRRRARASEISASDIDIDFILDERSRELLLEEERRWTLLRLNKWIERTRQYNNNGGQHITERDKLFPIPQSVIDANLTSPMPQNPGY